MPEEPEVETERLHEAIHEEMEKEGGRFLRGVAMTTAVLAALASVAALQAGQTVNEALILKTEAARLETAAADQWAYYQAKGIKLAVLQAAGSTWQAVGKAAPASLAEDAKRYQSEQETSRRAAQDLERKRDTRSHEADAMLHRHHSFANAVSLFQVAIALGAVAALTRLRWVWAGSVFLGAAGLAMLAAPYLGAR
jgi:hypothetical protein